MRRRTGGDTAESEQPADSEDAPHPVYQAKLSGLSSLFDLARPGAKAPQDGAAEQGWGNYPVYAVMFACAVLMMFSEDLGTHQCLNAIVMFCSMYVTGTTLRKILAEDNSEKGVPAGFAPMR